MIGFYDDEDQNSGLDKNTMDSIYEVFFAKEKTQCVSSYLEKQIQLSAEMRQIVIDWLMEVSVEYRMIPEVIFYAVHYIDKYLEIANPMHPKKLQLLGIASLLLASKFIEEHPPAADEMVYITDNSYTKAELFKCEKSILHGLGFKMSIVTPMDFTALFESCALESIPDLKKHRKVLNPLTLYLLWLGMLRYSLSVNIPPSKFASVGLLLAIYTLLDKVFWTKELEEKTRCKCTDLLVYAKRLWEIFNCTDNTGKTGAVEYFERKMYRGVSKRIKCPETDPMEAFKNQNEIAQFG